MYYLSALTRFCQRTKHIHLMYHPLPAFYKRVDEYVICAELFIRKRGDLEFVVKSADFIFYQMRGFS